MSTQDGWTTSSTATSDLLKRPYGEIKSDAKLLTRPSRHAANQRTSTCDQTLCPVEQPIKRTMRPLARPTRQSQHPLQPPGPTQKQSRPRQPLAEGSRLTQQLQPPSRPQPRRQSTKLPRPSTRPEENSTTARQPPRRSHLQRLSQTELANQHGNNHEHWLGPPLPSFKHRSDVVRESRQSSRQSQQISDQRVRKSQQIPNQMVDRPLQPSNSVPDHQAFSPSSQQISAGFPPPQSDKSVSNDSTTSSESYNELSPARRRETISSTNEFVQTAIQRDNTFEHWLGPPLPSFKHRPDIVRKSRQFSRQSQQMSDQRVRKSQQIPNQTIDRPLQPSNLVPDHQGCIPSAQQIPRSSQQIPVGFPPLQQRQSDKSVGSDSTTSSESYNELSPARRRETISSTNEFVQTANQRDNTFEHWLGPPLPSFKHRPDVVRKSRQFSRQSQQMSDQRVRKSQQIPNQTIDRPLQPSNLVPDHQGCIPSAQQIPRSSQQIPVGFPPLQRRQSDKSVGSDSTTSSELYNNELSPARRRKTISSTNEFVQTAIQRDNTFEHWLGPPLPSFKHRPDVVRKSRQFSRQSQQMSDQRVRKSQQIPNQTIDRPLQPSNLVPDHQGCIPSAQQIPRSSQQIPVGFPPLQRRQSDKSVSTDSTTSSESYIELSPARRREIITSTNESVQYVMASMLSDKASNVQWKPKLRKKDISYYVDETSVKPGQTRFCCVSRTHATVDEIMKMFVVSDPDSMARNKRILSDSLLETQLLSVLRRPTEERPMNSMYVEYMSYRSPGLMVDREVCIAVATDMIHQPDGSTIGYCLWETVDGPEFAEATNKLAPCIMFRSGFFFRRSGRRQKSATEYPSQSYTKIVYMVGLEPGGWAPGLTTRLLMEKFGTTVTRLCSHFRRKQLDSRKFVMKTEWTSRMSAKSCNECERQLQVLSNRVNCHSCGHVVCRSCVSKELVELHAIGLVPMYICFSCLEKANLPTRTSSQKTRSSLGRRRLQSDTSSFIEVATRQTLSQPHSYRQTRSVVDSGLIEEDDDEDSDTGEWAFTPSGVPVRPYQMESQPARCSTVSSPRSSIHLPKSLRSTANVQPRGKLVGSHCTPL